MHDRPAFFAEELTELKELLFYDYDYDWWSVRLLFSRIGVKPPVLVTPLQNVETSEQGPAKFTAKITGFPEPAATW